MIEEMMSYNSLDKDIVWNHGRFWGTIDTINIDKAGKWSLVIQ
jgi:hypothetical protein